MSPEAWLKPSAEVAAAMAERRPLVALESTIIAHGMPWPENLETARELEAIVRRHGAVPATIAVLKGMVRIGLEDDELAALAKSGTALKVSRRDLPRVVALGETGATTVAATMICARHAGIRLFATGGIGGVHRGGERSMDISADLAELSRTTVAVVCAGAKAILDIGRTLEYLETHGVPVIGYRCDAFPAFYCRDSGFAVDVRLDEPEQVARLLKIKWDMALEGGAVIANPVPAGAAMDENAVQEAIGKALAEAASAGVSGKAVTPFLLKRVVELTGGASLAANRALVRHNAEVAARIAVALHRLERADFPP